VTGAKREPRVPDIPTMAEAGVPGYEFSMWCAMFAPAATPKAIVTRLNAEVVKALATTCREQIDLSGFVANELSAFVCARAKSLVR